MVSFVISLESTAVPSVAARDTEPPRLTAPPPESPVPAVTVIPEFSRSAFATLPSIMSAPSMFVMELPVPFASKLTPVNAPDVEISQSFELIATVFVLLPSVTTPVAPSVVNAPVDGVDAPMVVASIDPPPIATDVAVNVPESINSESAMPPSSAANSLELMVAPPTVTSLLPTARAVPISASDASIAVVVVAPIPELKN